MSSEVAQPDNTQQHRDFSQGQQDAQNQPKGEEAEAGKKPEGLTKEEKELANRLSSLIEKANNQVVPVVRMIRKVCLHSLYRVLCRQGLMDPVYSISRPWKLAKKRRGTRLNLSNKSNLSLRKRKKYFKRRTAPFVVLIPTRN
jgi:hypothetical protein